jgi:hypothetical protein
MPPQWAVSCPNSIALHYSNVLRLFATVTHKFFSSISLFPPISPLFFHLPQRFPLNTPSISHYNYKISFSISTINFLSTNNYSWTTAQCLGMNSDTLYLREREGSRRVEGVVGGSAAAVECPYRRHVRGGDAQGTAT